MARNKLIFDKSNSIRSRTKEYKNHSCTLKLKNSEVIFINGYWNLGYKYLNSFEKLIIMDLLLWASVFYSHIKTDPKPLLVSWNSNSNKPWILAENKLLIKPNMKENNKNN